MKRFALMFFAPLLVVVVLVAGLGVGQSMSMMMLSGVAGGQVSGETDNTCTVDVSISTVGSDDLSRAEDIAKNLLANPYHIDMSGLESKANTNTELVSAILGNMKYESGFIPASYQATEGYAPDGTVLGKFPAVTKLNVKRGEHEDNQTMLGALDKDGVREEGGRAIGLAQWDGGRSVDLIKFAMGRLNGSPFKDRAKQWDTVEVQAAFLLHEMVGSQKSFVEQIKGLNEMSGNDEHVRQLTEQWYRKFERGPLPENADTAEKRKSREDNIAARQQAAVDLHKHVIEWAQQVHVDSGWSPSSSSGSCSSDSGSVEGGSLADFKYDGKLGVGGAVYVQNWRDWVKYGWDDSSSFDAGLLPGSTGQWAYPKYQCTMWTAARLFSLGLTKRLMDAGIAFGSLSTLGNGGQQVGSLGGLGVPTGKSPQVHDVVSFNNGVDQSSVKYGHVGVVEKVEDGGKTFISSEGNACEATYKDCVKLRKHTVQDGMTFAHIEEFLKSKGK